MYLPSQFKEERVPVLHQAIRDSGIATLVTHGPDGMIASHVPMLLDPAAGEFGTLYGHVARANPQVRGAPAGGEALAIFLGPDAYVTPSWYEAKRETGKVVPTWNYAAIHAYGPIEWFEAPDRLLKVVEGLTSKHEAGRAEPWAVSDAPQDFLAAMLKGIIGFALPIIRLEGKWKMSQNRPEADRARVAAGLAEQGQVEVARLVERGGAGDAT